MKRLIGQNEESDRGKESKCICKNIESSEQVDFWQIPIRLLLLPQSYLKVQFITVWRYSAFYSAQSSTLFWHIQNIVPALCIECVIQISISSKLTTGSLPFDLPWQ